MSVLSLFGSINPRKILGYLTILLLFFVGVQSVSAQTRKSAHTISVSMEGSVCTYVIDQPNQDLILINPGGTVTFKATGVEADFEIKRFKAAGNPRNGNKGVGDGQPSKVSVDASENATKTDSTLVQVRSDRSGKTTHKIQIDCLVAGEPVASHCAGAAEVCSGPSDAGFTGVKTRIPAVSLSSLQETKAGFQGEDSKGKSKETKPIRDEGGPGMEIDP